MTAAVRSQPHIIMTSAHGYDHNHRERLNIPYSVVPVLALAIDVDTAQPIAIRHQFKHCQTVMHEQQRSCTRVVEPAIYPEDRWLIPAIEGNGDIKIRGTIGGSQGTFSGKFSADAINAVESIHIRDGAVSAYYGFGRPPMVNGEFTDFTFTLPAQSMDAVYILHGMMASMSSFWYVSENPQETHFPIGM